MSRAPIPAVIPALLGLAALGLTAAPASAQLAGTPATQCSFVAGTDPVPASVSLGTVPGAGAHAASDQVFEIGIFCNAVNTNAGVQLTSAYGGLQLVDGSNAVITPDLHGTFMTRIGYEAELAGADWTVTLATADAVNNAAPIVAESDRAEFTALGEIPASATEPATLTIRLSLDADDAPRVRTTGDGTQYRDILTLTVLAGV